MKKKRAPGLIAIVLYKTFVATLLAITAIAILLALRNYEDLSDFAEDYILEGKSNLVDWILETLLNQNPRTLRFSGFGALGYAIVTAIEAIGLWYEKRWAHVLVVFLVAISIPPEIYELIRGISTIKAMVFVINVAVLIYLVKTFPRHPASTDS